jgi:hypothetical protein
MRIMLDENIPHPVSNMLQDHSVSTVAKEGWQSIQNGALLDRIEDHFDALITCDGNMLYQNRFIGRNLSVIILPTNRLALLRANAAAIVETLADIEELGFHVAIDIRWSGQRTKRRLDIAGASEEDMEPVPAFHRPWRR